MSNWRVVGASVPGTAHLTRGIPCQDAHAFARLPDGGLLVAVADGAGSASHAADGARLASQRVVSWLEAQLGARQPSDELEWAQLMEEAFHEARDALVKRARNRRLRLRDLSTTLTCLVATDEALAVGHIGDSVAVISNGDGRLELVAHPQRGEYANEVMLLTMRNALNRFEVRVLPRQVHALAVTSDGLLRLATKLPHYDPFPPFFAPLFDFTAKAKDGDQAATALAHFLQSERVNARTDDDKTLVLAARLPEPSDDGGRRTEDGRSSAEEPSIAVSPSSVGRPLSADAPASSGEAE